MFRIGGDVRAFGWELGGEPLRQAVDGGVGEDDDDGVDEGGVAAGRLIGGDGEEEGMLEVGGVAMLELGEVFGEVGVLDVGLEAFVNLGGLGATELGAIGGVDDAVGIGLLFDVGGAELGQLEGAGFDEDGVFGFGCGDLGEGGGVGRDDEGVAAFIFVGEGADREGFGGGIDPERLGCGDRRRGRRRWRGRRG